MALSFILIMASAVALGLALLSIANTRAVQSRLTRVSARAHAVPAETTSGGVLADGDQRKIVRLLASLGHRAGQIRSTSLGPLRTRLREAGLRSDSALVAYMGSRFITMIALPVALMPFPALWSLNSTQWLVLMMCAAGIGFVAPSYWLDRRRKRRQLEIQHGLPDALDLMVVCVESGLGINASLARVANEFAYSNRPLSEEFELVTLETRAGKSTSAALRSLAQRTGVADVSSLAAMMIQTERFGTSLGDTLRVHADYMRIQRIQRAEEQAALAPLKMLFPTVIIFAATLLVVVGPAMIQFLEFFDAQGLGN